MNSNYNSVKINQDIRKLNRLIYIVERAGGELPDLKRAVRHLEFSLNTGDDLISACYQVSKAFRDIEIESNRNKLCGNDDFCHYEIARGWQGRTTNWVLSWENKNSVVSVFIRNTICRYFPERLNEWWDYCESEI